MLLVPTVLIMRSVSSTRFLFLYLTLGCRSVCTGKKASKSNHSVNFLRSWISFTCVCVGVRFPMCCFIAVHDEIATDIDVDDVYGAP